MFSTEGPSLQGRFSSTMKKEEPVGEDVVKVNRWQDLQNRLGDSQDDTDLSFPAVLRYKREESDS
jgi:hypothetical protein